MSTAHTQGVSRALRAEGTVRRHMRIEFANGPLVMWFPEPMTAADVSDFEATFAILIGSLKRRFALDEPRGLSAAEAPTSAEGVNPTNDAT